MREIFLKKTFKGRTHPPHPSSLDCFLITLVRIGVDIQMKLFGFKLSAFDNIKALKREDLFLYLKLV